MSIFSAIQITSTDDLENNLYKTFKYIDDAIKMNAKVISLPEVFPYIGNLEDKFYQQSLNSELVSKLKTICKENKVFIVSGSFHEKISTSNKSYNTSLLISDQGEIVNEYRKIHLFDAVFETESYKESDNFEAGSLEQIKVTKTPYGNIGLSICYDLRFPEFYRILSKNGADIIFVPAAFTMRTGKEHWEVLLRARAIENQVYIVAPNQFGFHDKKRESYGNSMIIDPWGKVIARASDTEGVIFANIDLDYLNKVRKNLPCLEHRKI
ncbi:MAG: carbon-nitrogen hydrolase family protein [Candidatus Sericytochromatia bacterium]